MSGDERRAPEQPGPSDFRDPLTARELKRAAVWLGLGVVIALTWLLAQPLLLIVGGLVFASMLDGGTRLLGRILPIPRGFRLAIVCLATLAFLAWTIYFAGASIGARSGAGSPAVSSPASSRVPERFSRPPITSTNDGQNPVSQLKSLLQLA